MTVDCKIVEAFLNTKFNLNVIPEKKSKENKSQKDLSPGNQKYLQPIL